jgi:hypothetical protein
MEDERISLCILDSDMIFQDLNGFFRNFRSISFYSTAPHPPSRPSIAHPVVA